VVLLVAKGITMEHTALAVHQRKRREVGLEEVTASETREASMETRVEVGRIGVEKIMRILLEKEEVIAVVLMAQVKTGRSMTEVETALVGEGKGPETMVRIAVQTEIGTEWGTEVGIEV